MTVSQDSLALLKLTVKLAHSKIANSFLFTDNDIETRLGLLLDASDLLLAVEFYLELGSLHGLDDALSCLSNNCVTNKIKREKVMPLIRRLSDA
jgi:hypothetical protein